MRKVSLILALVSIPAFAAPQATDYERSLSKASKWSDISAQLKGHLPSNVVKEFSNFSKDIEFPSTRRIKNKLVITQNDGTKVTVVFKPDGAISLNGKDWRLNPLSTVEEEVGRLALFLNGEKKADSSLLGLVPAASAGGAGGLGAAAAAYAGANAWKADACGEGDLSEDLASDCPLMAVKMRPILVKGEKTVIKKYVPVGLKCPDENRGILELITRNGEGGSQRIRVKYDKKSSPKIITVEMAESGQRFEQVFQLEVGQALGDGAAGAGEKVLKFISPVKTQVCEGDEKYKKRFYEFMAANLADTPISKIDDEDSKSEKGAIEAL